MLRRLLRQDWEVIAIIVASLAALVLHFLHYIEQDVLLTLTVVLLAMFLIRDVRRENQAEHFAQTEESIKTSLEDIKSALTPAGIELVGPSELQEASLRFAKRGRGEVIFFNICLRMYKAQEPFEIMLKPFLENENVTSIQFILDPKEKERWDRDVMSKVSVCEGCGKVKPPFWCSLEENVSFIMVETGTFGKAEALLSFWGEPFMARMATVNVPRYVLYVRESSELIRSLKERERICRSA